ncbi:MAG: hypothetical protein WAP03_22470 [Methylorubrum rhodinum]|uniref:hypothetical protein n=1 Tax=Methylorubrum rhodinum TaxID=29428 RepID=UPI003BAF4C3E
MVRSTFTRADQSLALFCPLRCGRLIAELELRRRPGFGRDGGVARDLGPEQVELLPDELRVERDDRDTGDEVLQHLRVDRDPVVVEPEPAQARGRVRGRDESRWAHIDIIPTTLSMASSRVGTGSGFPTMQGTPGGRPLNSRSACQPPPS